MRILIEQDLVWLYLTNHFNRYAIYLKPQIGGLLQDCSNNSSALAMELLQSCTKPLIYDTKLRNLKLTYEWLFISCLPQSVISIGLFNYIWQIARVWKFHKLNLGSFSWWYSSDFHSTSSSKLHNWHDLTHTGLVTYMFFKAHGYHWFNP